MYQRKNPKIKVRLVDNAPLSRPKSPSHVDRLKNDLDKAHQENHRLKEQIRCMSLHALSLENVLVENQEAKVKITRLEELLWNRETLFEAESKKSQETIANHEEQISNLKKSLQIQVEQLEISQQQNKQEYDNIAARLEAEKEKLSEQNTKAMLESQNNVMLQKELQNKLDQQDNEVLKLKKEKNRLSQRLTEATNHLWSNGKEFLKSDKAWQTKYQVLQEKFREEMAEKEQSWETRVQQVEEEKKELERCLEEEKSRGFWSRRDNVKTEETKAEEKKSKKDRKEMKKKEKEEKAEMKKKEKEEKIEMKKKEKEEKTEMKKKEKEEKMEMKKKEKEEKTEMKKKEIEERTEMKKKEKEEKLEMKKKEIEERAEIKRKEQELKTEMKKTEKKGFMSWMHKKKCDSDSEVEETAGCSSQVGQQ